MNSDKAKILIVGNYDEDLSLLERILSSENYLYEKVEKGEDVLSKLLNHHFPIVLLRTDLIDMQVEELCEILNKRLKLKDTDIIFLTEQRDINFIELGGVDFIKMPFNLREVKTRIKVHMDLRNMKKELNEKNKDLEEFVLLDSVAGVYNSRYIYKRLEEEIEKKERYKKDLSIVLYAVDDFEKIESIYGKDKEDDIVKRVANYLKKAFRRVDIVGCYENDKFLIILPETNFEKACLSAERTRKNIVNKNFDIDDFLIRISGIVVQSSKDETVDDYLKRALITFEKTQFA